MLLPKIIYDAGAGSVTLAFTYPPVNKPGTTQDREAEREDTFTTSGKKQSIYIRTDHFFNLQMDVVPIADLANWEAFADYALTGGSFDYYPDATDTPHTTYTLEDDKFLPKRAFFGHVKFQLRFRKKI